MKITGVINYTIGVSMDKKTISIGTFTKESCNSNTYIHLNENLKDLLGYKDPISELQVRKFVVETAEDLVCGYAFYPDKFTIREDEISRIGIEVKTQE